MSTHAALDVVRSVTDLRPEVGLVLGTGLLGLSIITDKCLPDALEPVSVERVLAVARDAEPRLTALVRGVLARMPSTGSAARTGRPGLPITLEVP